MLFQVKPVPAQTPEERAIRANYAQWQQAYKQKRPELAERLLSSHFSFTDVDGEKSSRKEFITSWIRADIKQSDAITSKILIYKIRPYGKQMRAVVDDGLWKHHDYWQKVGGVWKLGKRDMYGPSAAQDKRADQEDKKK